MHLLAPFGAFAGAASSPILVHYLLPNVSAAQLAYQALGIGAAVAVVVMLVHRPKRVVARRDVDAPTDAEEALRVSHERFESAATALECAIYEWNRDSDTVRWTTGLGHEPSGERPAEWWAEHVHPDDRDRLVQLEEGVHAGEREKETEYRFLRGDGTYAHVLDRWVATHDENGEVVRAVGGMVDVTHQRALEARLQQSEKMEALGRLAGGVAHDFNNLLTAIIGNADLLLHTSPGDLGWQEDVAEITRAADRAADLTGQLLTFSRGRGSSDVSADLDRTVNEMATMVGRLLGSDVGIELILDAGSGHVACDPTQLEQVVLNLALNGRDAMPEGGTLRIETGVVDGFARIVVSDTGIGMDEETAERIFEPFFTTKLTGKGTGLGLATVYGVVEQAGGSISVRTSVGGGTSFELLLPWCAAPEAAAARPDGATSSPGTGTILVVEDEVAVRAVVTRMLEQSGYSVVPTSSPLDALALLDDGLRPDLVVSDVVMPQLSGFALASRVNELHPALPFLFITGFTGTDERPEGLECHPILRKPFTADDLVGAVGGVLESTVVRVA